MGSWGLTTGEAPRQHRVPPPRTVALLTPSIGLTGHYLRTPSDERCDGGRQPSRALRPASPPSAPAHSERVTREFLDSPPAKVEDVQPSIPADNLDRSANLFLIARRNVKNTPTSPQCATMEFQRLSLVRAPLQEASKARQEAVPRATGVQETCSLRPAQEVHPRRVKPCGLQVPAGGICLFLVVEHSNDALHRVEIEPFLVLARLPPVADLRFRTIGRWWLPLYSDHLSPTRTEYHLSSAMQYAQPDEAGPRCRQGAVPIDCAGRWICAPGSR